MAVSENALHIYIYGVTCANVTLGIFEIVVSWLQGVCKIIALLLDFKLKTYYEM